MLHTIPERDETYNESKMNFANVEDQMHIEEELFLGPPDSHRKEGRQPKHQRIKSQIT